ncbi:putative phosphopantothenoylcysteine decarboxylase, partial [Intoshia linei]
MVNFLIGCTGSVAAIRLDEIIASICKNFMNPQIKIILTKSAQYFVHYRNNKFLYFTDEDEWSTWKKRGDPILHINLREWADIFLISPLDCNTLAKISHGLCDNLLV